MSEQQTHDDDRAVVESEAADGELVDGELVDGELVDYLDDAVVLLAGVGSPQWAPRLRQTGEAAGLPPVRLAFVDSLDACDEVLGQRPVGVLVVDANIGSHARASLEFLESLPARHSFQTPATVLWEVADPQEFQPLVQADRLYYAAPRGIDLEQTCALLIAALQDYRQRQILALAAAPSVRDRRAVVQRKVSSIAESLLQYNDLESAGDPVFEALQELIGARHARLWRYDSGEHLLFDTSAAELEASAVTGLTSFVARSGRPLRVARPLEDPRHDGDVDGASDGPFLAVPIFGAQQEVLGVLTAGRDDGEAFSQADEQVVEQLASQLSPLFVLYSPRPLDALLQAGQASGEVDLFRREAVEAQARGFSERGMVLRYGKGWAEWTWWTLLSGFLAALIFSWFGRMHDYASGPAVVRVGQRVEVTAPTDAAVAAVEVQPLERVELGQPLVRLDGAPEASQIANLEEEFEQRLRQRLVAPGDSSVEASLIEVRTRLDQARAQLDQRTIRAPSSGVVGDVRVRPGQYPAAGEFLLSIIADADERTVLGFIPGHFGPQLVADQRLRLTLNGYADLPLKLRLSSVGDEVIGVEEARQALGRSIADAVPLDGPVVLVEALLPEASFRDGRQTWAFNDGMQGTVEIRVRSRPILFHLIPGLETAFRGWHD